MMGDGYNINYVIKEGSMDDVGTRIKHMADLYELWQSGIDILDRYDKDTPFYREKRLELEHAIKLLGFYMERDYGIQEQIDRKLIDSLPHFGDQIKDDNSEK